MVGICLAADGCGQQTPSGPVRVSIIEGVRGSPTHGEAFRRALSGATDRGMLRLDETGQLAAGLASRWAMIDEGPDGIFRLDDDAGLGAPDVAGRLADALRRAPPWTGVDIVSVRAVTGSVVDVRLSAPRAALPIVLALPELAKVGADRGPMRLDERRGDTVRLESRASGDEAAPPVLLRGERVGRGVVRFVRGQSDLVLGGTFVDLPVARAASLPPKALRFDPATGLFGLIATGVRSALSDPRRREALSLAIDRDALVAALAGADGVKATTVAGSRYEAPLPERRQRARLLWGDGDRTALRLFVPDGAAGRLLLALLARDWRTLGVKTVAASDRRRADLALIDLVVPAEERARAACAAAAGCDPADPAASLAPPYIPLAQPIRWTLVAPSLKLFNENALAVHPLDRLRAPR